MCTVNYVIDRFSFHLLVWPFRTNRKTNSVIAVIPNSLVHGDINLYTVKYSTRLIFQRKATVVKAMHSLKSFKLAKLV